MTSRPRLTCLLAGALAVCAGRPLPAQFIHRSVEEEDLARQRKSQDAQPYRPPFSEFKFLLEVPPGAKELAPPRFIQSPQYAFPGREKLPGLSVLSGETLYDLERPPRIRQWWKIPLYVVVGMPRDAFDTLFGAAGYVPVVNLALTGGYELLGAQYLMRHPQDYHRYPGRANENKHGWINGDGWGWFSNARHMGFSKVDQERLDQWKQHNERVEAALRKQNEDIRAHNEQIDREAQAYRETARADLAATRYPDALARFWTYCRRRPTDFEALACFLACCIEQAGLGVEHSAWCEQETRRAMASWPAGNFPVLIDVLRKDAARWPDDPGLRYWLTWIYTRMESYPEALAEGRQLGRHPRAGLKDNVLYYEVCLYRLQQLDPKNEADSIRDLLSRMENAAERMRRLAPDSSETRLAVARLDILNGRYAEGLAELKALAEQNPTDAKHSYYYAAGLIFQCLFGFEYQKEAALAALQHAKTLSASPDRQAVIAEALEQAGKIRPQTPPRLPAVAE